MRCFEHIAKLIRTSRINHPKSYSQSELSNLLGYKNGQFISNVERALCSVPLKMLRRVGEVLDISAEELKIAILKDQEITIDNYFNSTEGQKEAEERAATAKIDQNTTANDARPAEFYKAVNG